MPRRFITRQEIDRMVDAGETVLVVDDHVTITDIAREQARERGLRIVRDPDGQAATGTATGAATGGAAPDVTSAVRAAVIARLGHEPGDLDAAVAAVLARSGASGAAADG